MDENKKMSYSIPLAIIISGVLIAGAIFYTKSAPPSVVIENPNQEADSNAKIINISGEPYLGNPEAPVKIVYYGDFQCPFCKLFETSVLSILKEKYLRTGDAVLYFKNFQFLGPDSQAAGVAGECLIKQLGNNFGPYWKWHEAMIENQDDENSGWGNTGDIKILVRELGLDKDGIELNQFDTCLDNEETLAEVQADTQEGQADGVSGTPSSIINGQLIVGLKSISEFESVINAELGSN